MTNPLLRRFRRCLRHREAMFREGELSLLPKRFVKVPYTVEYCDVWIFAICVDGNPAGEIALRIGEGDALFYLGHIGYHIDPSFRGHHYAEKACRMTAEVFRSYGMRSYVITTDCDNWASIRTCERLGCVHESTVEVPGWCRRSYELGSHKERFVFLAI